MRDYSDPVDGMRAGRSFTGNGISSSDNWPACWSNFGVDAVAYGVTLGVEGATTNWAYNARAYANLMTGGGAGFATVTTSVAGSRCM